MPVPIGTKVVILDRPQLIPRCIAGMICTVVGYEDNPPNAITRLRLDAEKNTMFRYPTLFPWEVETIEE